MVDFSGLESESYFFFKSQLGLKKKHQPPSSIPRIREVFGSLGLG